MDMLRPDRPGGNFVRPIAPPITLARFLMVLAGLSGLVSLVSIPTGIARIHALTATRDAPSTLSLVDLGGLSGFARLATAVVFIIWLYQSVAFQTQAYRSEPRFPAGWAVGAWFVPFLNLVRPMQIVEDVWTHATTAASQGTARSSRIVFAWWLFWVGANLTAAFGFVLRRGSTGIGAADRLTAAIKNEEASVVSQALLVVAAVLVVLMVHRISRAQSESLRFPPPMAWPEQLRWEPTPWGPMAGWPPLHAPAAPPPLIPMPLTATQAEPEPS
jgi:hypothetical protein